MKQMLYIFMLGVWVAGWVIAKGFWSTFFAIVFVPWSWYLVVEKVLLTYGWV